MSDDVTAGDGTIPVAQTDSEAYTPLMAESVPEQTSISEGLRPGHIRIVMCTEDGRVAQVDLPEVTFTMCDKKMLMTDLSVALANVPVPETSQEDSDAYTS